MKSNLPQALLNQYMDTDYVISDDPPLLLRVGDQNDDARILMASMGVSTAAFITAWNPGSTPLGDDENDMRQAELLDEIEKRRLNYLVGYGERTDWREYSYLILGIAQSDASELAGRFDQNAYLWVGEDGLPELVYLA
ncbi:MAG: hypothetical protein ACI8Z1_000269 [Candidatus Azotimanducaceae bacterium]